MGHALGDVTAKREGRLTLNPLAHIDPVFTLGLPIMLILIGSPIVFGAAKPVPFNPYAVRYGKWGAALVAVAGPGSNLAMAIFGGIWLRIFQLGGLGEQFLIMFVVTNVAFFIFNMIPLPPLDGSRVLYAVAPPKMADVMEKIESYGLIGVFIFLLVLFPLIQPLFSSLVQGISLFLIGSAISG
jgi:Zn-dependent protease